MKNYKWDRFYLHMYYHADINVVFNSWATPEGQMSFFVRECISKRNGTTVDSKSLFMVGDTYEYLWEDNGRSSGEILLVDTNKHIIVFSFAGAKIQIRLEETPLGVLLELKHFDIPERDQKLHQLDCRVGWTHFLVNLKCLLEKGVDIREDDPACGGTLGWGINPPKGVILS